MAPFPFFAFAPLGPQHDRAAFSCGVEALDRYLRERARQDMARDLAAVFVLHDASDRIVGYYTLSAYAIQPSDLPESLARKLPARQLVPVTLLGRLAVDQQHQSQQLGRLVLIDALRRAHQATREVASMAVVVETIDDDVIAFYERFGFGSFRDNPRRLFLPMRKVAELLHA
jgi:GNAT superfamily N-acetyltransferase